MNSSVASTDDDGSTTWTLIDVEVPNTAVELVSDHLWSLGVVAVEEITNDGASVTTLRTSVGDAPESVLARIASLFPEAHVRIVEMDRAVADRWREHAQIVTIEGPLAIVPAWLDAPTDCDVVRIEPGDTFGLGNHATTIGALTLAMRHVTIGSRVFDLGTGSGILAVALAVHRGCLVQVNDISTSAREIVAHNSAMNGTTSVEWIETVPESPVDAVLANILAPVLIAERAAILKSTRRGGLIILSGMRLDQVERVLQHYPECERLDEMVLDGWVSVALRRIA